MPASQPFFTFFFLPQGFPPLPILPYALLPLKTLPFRRSIRAALREFFRHLLNPAGRLRLGTMCGVFTFLRTPLSQLVTLFSEIGIGFFSPEERPYHVQGRGYPFFPYTPPPTQRRGSGVLWTPPSDSWDFLAGSDFLHEQFDNTELFSHVDISLPSK